MSRNLPVIAFAALVILALQVWLSYLSYQSFAAGNLPLGVVLFLGVPALAILILLSFTAWRRHSPKWTKGNERQKNP